MEETPGAERLLVPGPEAAADDECAPWLRCTWVAEITPALGECLHGAMDVLASSGTTKIDASQAYPVNQNAHSTCNDKRSVPAYVTAPMNNGGLSYELHLLEGTTPPNPGYHT